MEHGQSRVAGRTLVYGVDGSPASLAAAQLAQALAARLGLEPVAVEVEDGDAAAELLAAAAEGPAELLAVGSRGRGSAASAVLGSVSAAVAARAPCPVLVFPQSALDRDPARVPETIVCAVDGRDAALEALRRAADLARRLDARLVLVHAVPGTTLPGASASPGAAERLRDEEIRDGEELLARLSADEGLDEDVARRVAVGAPARALAALAGELGAGLLVVGSRGRGSARSAVLGSVSHALASRAPCPVLVVSAR